MTAKWQYKQAYEGVLEGVRILKAENDRLKRFAKLNDSTISVLNACIDDLNAENFKLRDLVSVVYGYYASGTINPCDLCDAIGCQYVGEAESGCRYRDHFDSAEAAGDEIQRRMRALGIEAE